MDSSGQHALFAVDRCVVHENFDFGCGLLLLIGGGCRRDLALMPLAQIHVAAENASGQDQRAENSHQQPPGVTLLFFRLDGDGLIVQYLM